MNVVHALSEVIFWPSLVLLGALAVVFVTASSFLAGMMEEGRRKAEEALKYFTQRIEELRSRQPPVTVSDVQAWRDEIDTEIKSAIKQQKFNRSSYRQLTLNWNVLLPASVILPALVLSQVAKALAAGFWPWLTWGVSLVLFAVACKMVIASLRAIEGAAIAQYESRLTRPTGPELKFEFDDWDAATDFGA